MLELLLTSMGLELNETIDDLSKINKKWISFTPLKAYSISTAYSQIQTAS